MSDLVKRLQFALERETSAETIAALVDINDLKAAIATLSWISVDEPPKSEGWVMVYHEYLQIPHPAYWNGDDFMFAGVKVSTKHWQPTSPPPEQGRALTEIEE